MMRGRVRTTGPRLPIDVSDPFRWGMLGVSLVVAVVLTVLLRLLGHRVADAYDVLSFFNW